MIRLSRLRNPNPLYLNADHIERLDSHHETTVHLANGNEYVVTESAEEIVRLVAEQRARVLVLASRLQHEDDVRHRNEVASEHSVWRSPTDSEDSIPLLELPEDPDDADVADVANARDGNDSDGG